MTIGIVGGRCGKIQPSKPASSLAVQISAHRSFDSDMFRRVGFIVFSDDAQFDFGDPEQLLKFIHLKRATELRFQDGLAKELSII